GGRGGRARAGDRATPAARARGWTGTAPPGNGGRLSVAPGPRRWVGLAAVRAPALPAQRFLGGGFGRGAKPPSEALAARQPRRRGVPRREDDADPLLDREAGGEHAPAVHDHHVAEVEVIGGDEDRHHFALAFGCVEQELARDEPERVFADARVLDENDRPEGSPPLGREGVDQHLHGWLETPADRHPQDELVVPGEHTTADDFPRDRALE